MLQHFLIPTASNGSPLAALLRRGFERGQPRLRPFDFAQGFSETRWRAKESAENTEKNGDRAKYSEAPKMLNQSSHSTLPFENLRVLSILKGLMALSRIEGLIPVPRSHRHGDFKHVPAFS